jgi:hypothetical protein
LYPKPQIRLTMMGHDGVERPREIASPEKLYFYTSVIEGEGEDTDAWQPVRDVDFCDRPPPVVGAMRPTSAPDDVFVGSPPLAFTFGLGGLAIFPLRFGATATLLENASPANMIEIIETYKATISFTAPTAYRVGG